MGYVFLTLCFEAFARDDPGGLAAPVLKARCLPCHGAQLKKPEGDFVLEMGKVSGPHMANLVKLVGSGNMPPHNAPSGRLSAGEKDAVLSWVAAGGPAPAVPPGAILPPGPAPDPEPPETFTFWQHAGALVGNFHVLLLHFPIVLVLAGAASELWFLRSADPRADFGGRVCLVGAALFAVPVAITGWIHALEGYGESQATNLFLHRILGTVVAGGLAGLAGVEEWLIRRHGLGGIFRAPLIFVAAILVVVTAHLGGMLSHGANFLSW